MRPPRPKATLFPYTTLFRSDLAVLSELLRLAEDRLASASDAVASVVDGQHLAVQIDMVVLTDPIVARSEEHTSELHHGYISYAVFCLTKKTRAAATSLWTPG